MKHLSKEELKEELDRLELTNEYIKKTLEATEEYKTLYKANIQEAMENLDYLDSSQSYISVLINTKFMEIAERNYESLQRTKDKPYFARIDFKQEGGEKKDKIYIGKTSLFKAQDAMPLIVDWRSPIANLYYEGRIGENSYQTDDGVQEGEMTLKRQYTIENAQLKDIMDIDITANDAFLQAALEENAEDRLKDIASTIQAEQNRVIRADIGKPLLVQGVAGSGKTTIALHRIAYFLYRLEDKFFPEELMILAPNKLFINYISEVLPELGVERVKQTTYIDFMHQILGKSHRLADSGNKIQEIIRSKDEGGNLLGWASKFKGSIHFKEIVDAYLSDVERSYTPDEDFVLADHVIMSRDEIRGLMEDELYYLPLKKRSDHLKKLLSTRFKKSRKNIIEDVENHYNDRIEDMRHSSDGSEESRLKVVKLIDIRDQRLEELAKESKNLVKSYMSKFPKLDLFQLYTDLVTDPRVMERYSKRELDSESLEHLCDTTGDLLAKKRIELEDLAPLVYMKKRLLGFEEDLGIKSVVIDEAQDFSVFQLLALRSVVNTKMFTLLGDISQGIHSYRGIDSWEEVIYHAFDDDISFMHLEQSYRTTIEIMDLANRVIDMRKDTMTVLAKPVIRHGEEPEIISFKDKKDLVQKVVKRLRRSKEEGFKSIALVCKTMDEAKAFKKHLDKSGLGDVMLLDEKQEDYHAGIMIVPSYLAKGLEFDVVVLASMEEDFGDDDLDIKLLYVAMTRALHRLHIYRMEGNIKFLPEKNI
ncbi:RNA polymerase recycling motor HelD [Gudongella sp. SC589]|uniref:RNA polymerase recycling motor HelD n=1 Tax=Gudongella sp. SC589 TaxID=3385990 RepID=UPI003904BDF2